MFQHRTKTWFQPKRPNKFLWMKSFDWTYSNLYAQHPMGSLCKEMWIIKLKLMQIKRLGVVYVNCHRCSFEYYFFSFFFFSKLNNNQHAYRYRFFFSSRSSQAQKLCNDQRVYHACTWNLMTMMMMIRATNATKWKSSSVRSFIIIIIYIAFNAQMLNGNSSHSSHFPLDIVWCVFPFYHLQHKIESKIKQQQQQKEENWIDTAKLAMKVKLVHQTSCIISNGNLNLCAL